jgi:hypothetical protein
MSLLALISKSLALSCLEDALEDVLGEAGFEDRACLLTGLREAFPAFDLAGRLALERAFLDTPVDMLFFVFFI